MIIALVLDQATKAVARSCLVEQGRVTVVPGIVDLCLVFNEGAAFSLGAGWAWLFVVVAIVIVAACVSYVLFCKPSAILACVLGLVSGGGVGNMVDRVTSGGLVTDFILPTCIDFAVFNVADIFITVGFAVAFVLIWRENPSEVAVNDQASR